MEKLTNKEEEIMLVLWRLNQAFVKEIINEFEDPKPHYNTTSTIVRILEEKGFVGHETYGKSHQYYPLVSQEEYKQTYLQSVVKNYFQNSYSELVSFFTKKENLSEKELNEIIDSIQNQNND